MKKIFGFVAAAALSLGFNACQVESEDTFSTSPQAPELYAHNDILLTNGTPDEDVIFAWSPYRNLDKGLSYQLYAEYDETSVSLYNGTDIYFKTDKESFRQTLLSSFPTLPENDTFAMTFYVVVSAGGEEYQSNMIVVNIYARGDGVAAEVSLVAEELALDPADPTAEVALITWTPARLVYGEEVTYNVYLRIPKATPTETALGRRALDSDYQLAEGLTGTSYSTTVDALNEAIVAAGGAEAADVDVQFIVEAVCESLPGGVEAASAAMTVTTYVTTFPDVLYVPGSHQGWAPASAPTIMQSSAAKGYYEGIVDLTTEDGSDAEFKFCIVPDWGGDFGGEVEVTVKDAYTQAIGTVGVRDNIKVPSGKYVIMLNKKLNTIRMVSIKSVGVIGTAVGGWSDEITMDWNEETNVFTTTVDALVAGEYKFRLNNDWDWSVDDSGGINGGGANYQNTAEGAYKIQLDMSKHPYSVKFINLSFPESLGVTGNHQGWDPASAPRLNGDGEGHYEGFLSLDGEFKFTPNLDWSAEYAGSLDNLVTVGGGNLNAEKGYYKVTVDLTELKATLSAVTTVEVVGSFTDWNTADEYLMTYNAASDSWKLEGATIPAGAEWKFRMNKDWAINLGTNLSDLVQDGGNITGIERGIYTVELFLSTTPYHATLTKTGELDGPAFSTRLVVAGDYSGHSWNGTGDPALLGTGDGHFQGPITMYNMTDGFKFVHNGSWLGSSESTTGGWILGDGSNMTLPNGTYFFNVDLVDNRASYEAITKVGLIGDFNDWSTDVEMHFNENDYTYFGNITTTAANQGFKIRFNGEWTYSLGGDINELTSLNGSNIYIEKAGTYVITLDMASATPYLTIKEVY